jgi:hypothetical protein
MFKSKSVPINMNDYDQIIEPILKDVKRGKESIIIKNIEFKGTEPIGICYKNINNKIIITDIIKDSIADNNKEICIGMELIEMNGRTVKKYNKTMDYIKNKYKLHKYIKLTLIKYIKKDLSEVFEIERY